MFELLGAENLDLIGKILADRKLLTDIYRNEEDKTYVSDGISAAASFHKEGMDE